MHTNPGMGIYSTNDTVRLKDIYHEPTVGYYKTDGKWCPKCKKKHKYSWIEPEKKCEVCNEPIK